MRVEEQIGTDRETQDLSDEEGDRPQRTSGGVQGLQTINTMEFVVRALRGWVVPLTVPISKSRQVFGDDGTTEGG